MSLLSQTAAITAKDLRIEWRGRGRTIGVAGFAAVVLLLFSFAASGASLARDAGGYYWLALLFGSVLSLADAFKVESEDDALERLLLLPVDPRAIFLGKALARTIALGALALALLPVAGLLFGVGLGADGSALVLAALVVLGVAGLAAPGTLYAAMTSQVRGREVLLPLLLFPLTVPVVLALVKGTTLALGGDPMGQAGSWLALLLVFDLLYWSVCPLVFAAVVER